MVHKRASGDGRGDTDPRESEPHPKSLPAANWFPLGRTGLLTSDKVSNASLFKSKRYWLALDGDLARPKIGINNELVLLVAINIAPANQPNLNDSWNHEDRG